MIAVACPWPPVVKKQKNKTHFTRGNATEKKYVVPKQLCSERKYWIIRNPIRSTSVAKEMSSADAKKTKRLSPLQAGAPRTAICIAAISFTQADTALLSSKHSAAVDHEVH